MSRSLRIVTVLLGLIVAPLQQLAAQASILPAGERARVFPTRRARPIVGELVSADSVSFVLRREGDGRLVTVRWAEVARLDMSMGRSSRVENTARGVAYGFLTGFALGTIAVLVTYVSDLDETCPGECYVPPTLAVAFFAVMGTGAATVGGGLIGLLWPTESWLPVSLGATPPRVVIRSPSPGRLGIGLAMYVPRR